MKAWGVLAASLMLALTSEAAQTVPSRKPGLWEIQLTGEAPASRQPVTVQQCLDKAHDREMLLSLALGQDDCKRPRVQRQGVRTTLASRCVVHGQTLDLAMEWSGDFQSQYAGRYQVRNMHTGRVESTRFEARWLSACRTGMRPGDMVLPNGITVNVLRASHSAPSHPHHD